VKTLEQTPAFSLTPALFRWERENGSQRSIGIAALAVSARLRGCSLSQRERVRVREKSLSITNRFTS